MAKDKDEAMRPDVFATFRDIEVPTKVEEEKDPEDVALKNLAHHDGWKYLEEYINRLQLEMKELVKASIANGSSFDDIGRITVVSNLAIEKLDQVKQKVNDAKGE